MSGSDNFWIVLQMCLMAALALPSSTTSRIARRASLSNFKHTSTARQGLCRNRSYVWSASRNRITCTHRLCQASRDNDLISVVSMNQNKKGINHANSRLYAPGFQLRLNGSIVCGSHLRFQEIASRLSSDKSKRHLDEKRSAIALLTKFLTPNILASLRRHCKP